jgi:hypothetical protein
MWAWVRVGLLASLCAILSVSAQASTFVALSVNDLVDKSGAVVVGVSGPRISQWEGGRIVSYTEVTVDSPIAGNPKSGDVVVVRTMGGEVDDIGQVATGEASLAPNARALLFLRALPDASAPQAPASFSSGGRWVVTGMSQGELPVYQDSSFQFRVGQNPTEATIIEKQGQISAQKHFKGQLIIDAISEIQSTWSTRGKK